MAGARGVWVVAWSLPMPGIGGSLVVVADGHAGGITPWVRSCAVVAMKK